MMKRTFYVVERKRWFSEVVQSLWNQFYEDEGRRNLEFQESSKKKLVDLWCDSVGW